MSDNVPRYPIELRQFEDGDWEACIPALGRLSCIAVGSSLDEAIANLGPVRNFLVAEMKSHGIPLPDLPVHPVDEIGKSTKVFLVYKNIDQTEGRGPMVVDSIWLSREKAVQYMDHQPGIQGRRLKWSQEKWCGDWEIQEVSVRG